eukprot:TRINITY_DN2026_c0_g1_i1.p1 TRINITY_DN2026_c0_g1~~TRINITY_DN2026_c0_g1_i1.p1  ORF type:complete len:299 (-),score=79.59 TRINITY_DN2026_c0_g1_i1:93-989(-)
MSGYEDDLSDAQSAAVTEMKDRLLGLMETPDGAAMVAKFGGELRCMLRFLRVVNFKVNDAVTRWTETLKWRQEVNTAELSQRTPLVDRLQPWWPGEYCGTAKDGCVIQYFRVQYADPGYIVNNFSEEELRQFYIYWMERSLELQCESIAQKKAAGDNTPQRGTVEIYDLTGVGRAQFHMTGITLLGKVLGIGTAHYPSNLWKGFILQTPYIFYWSWKLITPILHPQTRERIAVDSHGCEEQLEANIDKEHLKVVFNCIKDPKLSGADRPATSDADSLSPTPEERAAAQEAGVSSPTHG